MCDIPHSVLNARLPACPTCGAQRVKHGEWWYRNTSYRLPIEPYTDDDGISHTFRLYPTLESARRDPQYKGTVTTCDNYFCSTVCSDANCIEATHTLVRKYGISWPSGVINE